MTTWPTSLAHLFKYAASRPPGTVTLAYEYARSWEAEPVQTFTVTIWARE